MAKKGKVKENDSLAWLKYLSIGVIKIFEIVASGIIDIFRFFKKMFARKTKKEETNAATVKEKTASKEFAKFEAFTVAKKLKGNYEIFEEKVMNESLIVLIFGKRGSGKSSLGFKMLENIRAKTQRKCFVLGVSSNIPSWIKSVDSVENVPEDGVILIDEGAISFAARDSMSAKNKMLTKIMAVARHKNLSLIFITQNTGFIDKNILALTDSLMIKEGSLLQIEMERPEVRKFYEKSEEQLKEATGNKKKYVYVINGDFEGVISYNLPSFWSENLSKNKK